MGKHERTLESKFENKCIQELRKLPNSFWPEKVESKMIRGLNDRTGCVLGKYVALEFKMDQNCLKDPRTKLQEYVLDLIEDSGGYAAFVYPENWPVIYNDIRKIAHKREL